MLLMKISAVWLLMVIAAIANGVFRDIILTEYLGHSISLPLSGLILSVLIGLITYKSVDYFQSNSLFTYVMIGAFWMTLTLIFEYGFGFAQGMEFSEISQVFHINEGNLFSLVLIVTLVSPTVAACSKRLVKKFT
jgi:hypothetical protein